MALFGLFRRWPPIRTIDELADFIDQQSAFVVQKGIYEYARARAGHYSKVLFGETGFQNAVELSRWGAYPLGLAMVGELVEGVLRPHAGELRRKNHEALTALVLSVFDRYPVPLAIGETPWQEARAALVHRLALAGIHAPKFAKDIPEPYVQDYFDLLPIHEKLRTRDFPTTRNYLRVTLCNIHDELTKRMDATAVAHALSAGAGKNGG